MLRCKINGLTTISAAEQAAAATVRGVTLGSGTGALRLIRP